MILQAFITIWISLLLCVGQCWREQGRKPGMVDCCTWDRKLCKLTSSHIGLLLLGTQKIVTCQKTCRLNPWVIDTLTNKMVLHKNTMCFLRLRTDQFLELSLLPLIAGVVDIMKEQMTYMSGGKPQVRDTFHQWTTVCSLECYTHLCPLLVTYQTRIFWKKSTLLSVFKAQLTVSHIAVRLVLVYKW